MKYALLAAAVAFAAPVMAQEAPPAPTGESTPMADQTAPTDATPPAADPMAQPAPMGQPAPPAPNTMTTQSQAPMATTGDPAGGYQPSGPAMQGTAQPGQQVVFQQAQTPDQAYPAPAPLQSYPVCKKGQYDKCRNPGGR